MSKINVKINCHLKKYIEKIITTKINGIEYQNVFFIFELLNKPVDVHVQHMYINKSHVLSGVLVLTTRYIFSSFEKK